MGHTVTAGQVMIGAVATVLVYIAAHSSDCEQRFRFKANAVPVETEQMPVGSTCGRCSVVKWPSWRPGHLTGYDIFARLFL
jgi:hypothetical protein